MFGVGLERETREAAATGNLIPGIRTLKGASFKAIFKAKGLEHLRA